MDNFTTEVKTYERNQMETGESNNTISEVTYSVTAFDSRSKEQ